MSFRALPRVFLPGLDPETESYELPPEEVKKFLKVLRLPQGAEIAVLPNDGTLIRCHFRAGRAWPIAIERPLTEPDIAVTLVQAFPKGDRFETVLRMGTELGVKGFVAFPAERSVVRWDAAKLAEKRRRYEAIIREAAEQSFRSKLPSLDFASGLAEVLSQYPDCVVLSEMEETTRTLCDLQKEDVALLVGPEGGWAPRELEIIGDRGVTLGPLVLRTDTAGIAAAAAMLLGR
jgi:16S rRNA (uracil1498-N3)-methyltransferase